MSESTFWAEIHRLDGQIRDVRANVDHRLAGFDLALLLLSAATDAAACKARLLELRKEMAALEKAQAQLVADREASQKAIDEANAEIERRRAAVLAREVDTRLRGEALAMREASRGAAPNPYPTDPNFAPNTRHPNGMARGPE